MSDIKDFEFNSSGWDNNRWDLHYIGDDNKIDIPEELIDKAKGNVTVSISANGGNEIESIHLPKNIYNVWLGTLYGASNLKKIVVDKENPYLKDIDGVLFTKDGKKLIKAPAQMTGKYVVPEGVETICSYAFQNSQIEEVVLPDTLTKIETGAFSWSNLRKIVVPKGVTEIEDSVFCSASKIEEFSFLGDVKIHYMYSEMDKEMENRIAKESFDSNSEAYLLACLKVYPNLEKLRRRFIASAKKGNREKRLEYLLSMESEKAVEKGRYETEIIDDNYIEIKKYIGDEKIIEIPSDINGKKVISIGKGCFEENDYIEKVVIPEGVEIIDKNAFKECVSLDEVIIPNSCTEINTSAFMNCKSLRKINLPDNLTILKSKVFCNCKSLQDLKLPKCLVKIDNEALKYCENLNDLDLPSSVTYLGRECFYACGFNHGPILENEWGYSCKKFKLPESITQIDDGCSGIFACYPKAKELFGVFEYKIILQVKKGSIPHRYASKKKIRFELID